MTSSKPSSKPSSPMPAKAGPAGMHSYFVSYPIFCVATDGQGLVITGGGGGGKAYGVTNVLQAHVVIVNAVTGEPSLETIASSDTGTEAPVGLDYSGSGFWACAMGTSILLFRFNDATLSFESVLKFSAGTNPNFVKIVRGIKDDWNIVSGGEDKLFKIWTVDSNLGSAALACQTNDHAAEVVHADADHGHILTCGKDGSVKIYGFEKPNELVLVASIQPRAPKHESVALSIRAAFFLPNTNEIVLLAHLPRGASFLMLFSVSAPATPKALHVVDAKQICPSMNISPSRDRVVIAHVGGQKDFYAVPSLKLVAKSNKHCHEMPPGNCLFVQPDLALSASPDFSLNFFGPGMRKNSFCVVLVILVLLALLALLVLYIPRASIEAQISKIINTNDEL